ncbi:DUF6457 domain-containing protein [Brachybacterium paraconglomeratum]
MTLQSDWETTLLPWMRDIAAHLEVGGVDRVHVMTGVVADGVQRSTAPISAFLVGAAVARGAGLEEGLRGGRVADPGEGGAAPARMTRMSPLVIAFTDGSLVPAGSPIQPPPSPPRGPVR